MNASHPKYTGILLSWYQDPTTDYCRLVPMLLERDDDGNEQLVPNPTSGQEGLIVYSEENTCSIGHFFAANGGRLFNFN